jgi:hypothetical protein
MFGSFEYFIIERLNHEELLKLKNTFIKHSCNKSDLIRFSFQKQDKL